MINGRDFILDDGLGTEGMTRGYYINVEPLFDQYGHLMGENNAMDVDVEGDGVISQNIGTTNGRYRNGMYISSQNEGNFCALSRKNLRGVEVLSRWY
jgi:hypothetical protein